MHQSLLVFRPQCHDDPLCSTGHIREAPHQERYLDGHPGILFLFARLVLLSHRGQGPECSYGVRLHNLHLSGFLLLSNPAGKEQGHGN